LKSELRSLLSFISIERLNLRLKASNVKVTPSNSVQPILHYRLHQNRLADILCWVWTNLEDF